MAWWSLLCFRNHTSLIWLAIAWIIITICSNKLFFEKEQLIKSAYWKASISGLLFCFRLLLGFDHRHLWLFNFLLPTCYPGLPSQTWVWYRTPKSLHLKKIYSQKFPFLKKKSTPNNLLQKIILLRSNSRSLLDPEHGNDAKVGWCVLDDEYGGGVDDDGSKYTWFCPCEFLQGVYLYGWLGGPIIMSERS
jgi:hypothetical protein